MQYTVFAQSDAVATINFIVQFCAASNREWRLLYSVLGKIFRNCKGLRKASFIRLTKNCDVA